MDRRNMHRLRFYQEELFLTKKRLFGAKSIKQVRFLQDRINFLQTRIDELENGKVLRKF